MNEDTIRALCTEVECMQIQVKTMTAIARKHVNEQGELDVALALTELETVTGLRGFDEPFVGGLTRVDRGMMGPFAFVATHFHKLQGAE